MVAFSFHAAPGALPAGARTASPSSPGHIDAEGVLRDPNGLDPDGNPWKSRIITDRTVFNGDIADGIAIQISGADVHDTWTWKAYAPGSSGLGPPDIGCYDEILAPGDAGDDGQGVELVTFCGFGGPAVRGVFSGECPCTPPAGYSFGAAVPMAGTANQSIQGTWSLFVDFTSGAGVTTLDVASDTMNAIDTPLVLVTHGWASSCDAMDRLMGLIRQELAVVASQVACAGYDSRAGVVSGAVEFGIQYRALRNRYPFDDPIHIVAHSMGGLVARYWYQELYTPSLDGAVGSISMLGTPNNGVNVAGLEAVLCPSNSSSWLAGEVSKAVCKTFSWGSVLFEDLVAVDLNSPSVRDLGPGSDVLKTLNDNFTLPNSPVFRAHAGLADTKQGHFTSGRAANDCFVSEESVLGPGAVFNRLYREFQYPGVSHTALPIAGCNEPTLTDDLDVVNNMLPDLKGETTVLAPSRPAMPSTPAALPPSTQTLASVLNQIDQNGSNTEDLTVPAGLAEADFTVSWLYDTTPPDLSFTLVRPDGTTVAATDADVAGSLDIGGTGAFYVLSKGFEMNNPAAGTWHVIVGGTTVPNPPQPYIVSLATDSAVALNLDIASDPIQAGTTQTITAELDDNGTAIAPTSIAASVLVLDGSAQAVTLHDDGLNGDAVAGDHVFTGSIDTTGGCGTYRVQVMASGSTSEGDVTREQLGTYDVSVPGDAVRDPCNPDEDADGLTDVGELNLDHTDPLNPDTDGDGLTDGVEANTTGTDPLVADSDSDGLTDGAEVNTYGTNPLVADTDGDGLTDGDEVNLYLTNPVLADTDADGLTDAQEINTVGTDPLVADTDGDHCGDGRELGGNHLNGGQRDPLDFWDFFDVTGDGSIDLDDTVAVLGGFGETPGSAGYGPLLDRYMPDAGQPWRTAAAIDGGGIDLEDAIASLQSFGDACG